MDKKINYILIGCGVIGIMIILAGSYILFRMNPESMVVQEENIQPSTLPAVPAETPPVIVTANSYGGVIAMVTAKKITLTKDDGSTEEFSPTDFIGMYDNRIFDAMTPITHKSLENGMRVQISISTNQSDKTEVKSLTVF